MLCPSCDHPTEDADKFCPNCGIQFNHESDSLDNPELSTNSENMPNSTFMPITIKSPERNKKTRTIAAISCIALFAIIMGLVGGFFYMKSALPTLFDFVFVNDKAFPDNGFRSLVSERFDLDRNGILFPTELEAITQIDFTDLSVFTYKEQPLATDPSQVLDNIAVGKKYDETHVVDKKISHIASIQGLEYFPKLQRLVCTGMNLNELDLSKCVNLKYVDCRNNNFNTLDVSNSKSLISLYCSDNVYIAGTDEAGLVCDDLLINASVNGGSVNAFFEQEFSYDNYGRLTTTNEKVFFYDEKGRLSGSYRPEDQRLQDATPSYTDEYHYDEAGRATSSMRHGLGYNNRQSNNPYYVYSFNTELEFDGTNRLIASDITLPSRLGDRSMTRNQGVYTYNPDSGLLDNAACDTLITDTSNFPPSTYHTSSTLQYSYSDSLLRSRESITNSEGGNGAARQYTHLDTYEATDSQLISYKGKYVTSGTTYDKTSGFPLETTQSDALITYECNIDGYITKATWVWSDTGPGATPSTDQLFNRVVNLTYVKHIGSSLYRDLYDSLPNYVFTDIQDYDTIDTLWQLSNGGLFAVTLAEVDPLNKARERAGLITGTVRSGIRFNGSGTSDSPWLWTDEKIWIPSSANISANEPLPLINSDTSD